MKQKIFKPEDKTECAAGTKGTVCARGRILEKMQQFTESRCNDDVCIKKMVSGIKSQLGVKRELDILKHPKFIEKVGTVANAEIDKLYKARGPATNTDLLSNIEIELTLDQWQNASAFGEFASGKFLHIPFEMRDFRKRSGSMLQNLNLQQLSNKYDCAACILNTDKWSGIGKHWFCIFITLGDEIVIEFFNSSGMPPLPEVVHWKDEKLAELYRNGGEGRMERIVDFELQKSQTECGMFCLCYIKARLEGISPDQFVAEFDDNTAISSRNIVFNYY